MHRKAATAPCRQPHDRFNVVLGCWTRSPSTKSEANTAVSGCLLLPKASSPEFRVVTSLPIRHFRSTTGLNLREEDRDPRTGSQRKSNGRDQPRQRTPKRTAIWKEHLILALRGGTVGPPKIKLDLQARYRGAIVGQVLNVLAPSPSTARTRASATEMENTELSKHMNDSPTISPRLFTANTPTAPQPP